MEELGFAGIWVADSQSVFRDAFDALTLCATRTRTLQLATGVTNPVTRHPAALAGTFATIDELSSGRAIIGIGVGESAVQNTAGLKPAEAGAARADATRPFGDCSLVRWPNTKCGDSDGVVPTKDSDLLGVVWAAVAAACRAGG